MRSWARMIGALIAMGGAQAAACDPGARAADPGRDATVEADLAAAFDCLGGGGAECRTFVADAAGLLWGIDDFRHSDGAPMTGPELTDWLAREGAAAGWRPLGRADAVETHQQASARAAWGELVVAAYRDPSDGFATTALVLPGRRQGSTSYGFAVSRIAQAGLYPGFRAFIGCPFSYGFRSDVAALTVVYAKKP